MKIIIKRLSDLYKAYQDDGIRGAILITFDYIANYYIKPVYLLFASRDEIFEIKYIIKYITEYITLEDNEYTVPSDQYLRDFGFCIFGPLLYAYFQHLYSLRTSNHPVVFLSREGFFLEKLYRHYLLKRNCNQHLYYIYTSRPYLFRCLLNHPDDIELSLTHSFSGMISDFLKTRYFLTNSEIEKIGFCDREIKLPDDNLLIRDIYTNNFTYLSNIGRIEENKYISYLKQEGLLDHKKCIISDIGFNGTSQDIMNILFNNTTDFMGSYIFSSHTDNETKLGAWSEGTGFCEGSSLIDGSIILETILTANHGQLNGFIHNSEKLVPRFNINGRTQRFFYLTEQIIDGAREFIDLDEDWYDKNRNYFEDTLDQLYASLMHSNIQFSMLIRLLDVDDEISGNNFLDLGTWI